MSSFPARSSRSRWRHYATTLALYISLGLVGILFLMPLYTVVVTAFKPLSEIVQGSMLAPPARWTTMPLSRAWSSACVGATCEGLAGGIWNSVCITVPAACASVTLGSINGYALTQWRLPGAHLMFALLLAANFMPYQIILIPMAVTLRELGLFGTVEGLILVHVVYGMPYVTLLFRNFYMSVPESLMRAARMDGGRFWSIFRHIILPLSPPMLFVALILQFTGIWNDYLFGLVFGGRDVPVTVMLDNLVNSQRGEKDYDVNMAGVLLAALPPLLVYLFAGRWFLRGLTVGSASR